MGKQKSGWGYESKHQPLLAPGAFARRQAKNFAVATGLVMLSLVVGMAGYHFTEGMPWIDAFVNASMILSGMGPLDPMKTWNGKLFAGLYALYSGLMLIISASVVLAPVIHRMMHGFHLETEESK